MKTGDDDGTTKKQLMFSDWHLKFWKEIALK
jgi:hypothetical protein